MIIKLSERYALEKVTTPDEQTHYEFFRYTELDDAGIPFRDDFCLTNLTVAELDTLAMQSPMLHELMDLLRNLRLSLLHAVYAIGDFDKR